MNKKRLTWVVSGLTLFVLLVVPAMVLGQVDVGFNEFEQGQPGLGTKDIRATIGSIINVIMGFLGVIAVIIILIGGFRWMTAGGNDEKVGEAKKLIISGIIGLAIVLAAYSIAKFVVQGLLTATTGQQL